METESRQQEKIAVKEYKSNGLSFRVIQALPFFTFIALIDYFASQLCDVPVIRAKRAV